MRKKRKAVLLALVYGAVLVGLLLLQGLTMEGSLTKFAANIATLVLTIPSFFLLKAYICLKSAWLLRGYAEHLQENGDNTVDRKALKAQEDEYLLNAYNGFVEARQSEGFPMCGMDEITVDYLLAELALRFKKYDVASKMVATILTSPSANNRMKDKARELKDEILAELKNRG